MSCGAYAAHRLEVDPEVLFGELRTPAPVCDLRREPPPCLGEGPPGLAAPVGAISHRLLDHSGGVRLRLFHQPQRSLVVGGVARQHIRRRDQSALGIDRQMRLVPVEAPPLALAPMSHLGIVNGDDAIGADSLFEMGSVLPALDVLKQHSL